MTLEPGTQLGPYRIEAPIGSGGFAVVYRAHDARLDTTVAVKVLAENHAFDAATRSRFADEARALRSINSSAVISVFDVGVTPAGQPFMVLDYADRGSLDQRSGAGPASTQDVLALVSFLGQAMHDLHEVGLVHRDIKPANVLLQSSRLDRDAASWDHGATSDEMLRSDDKLLLSDLGLAKDMRRASGITVGAGSPGFAAPEQLLAASQVDYRADLYSATALIASIVLGRELRSDEQWRTALTAAALPDALHKTLQRGLADDPADRPDSAIAWRDEIFAALQADPLPIVTANRPWRSFAAVGALLLLTVLTALGLRATLEQGVGAASERVSSPTQFEGDVGIDVPLLDDGSGESGRPAGGLVDVADTVDESTATVDDVGSSGRSDLGDGLGTRGRAASSPPATRTPTSTPTPAATSAADQAEADDDSATSAGSQTRTDPTATSVDDDPADASGASAAAVATSTATATRSATATTTRVSSTATATRTAATAIATSTPPASRATPVPSRTAVATSTPRSAPTSTPTPTPTATATATSTPTTTPTATTPTAVPLRASDVTISSASTVEADVVVEITVTLARPRGDEVVVNVSSPASAATPGSDFYGVREELTFPSGTTEQTFDVVILDDDEVEDDEVINLRVYTAGPTLAVGEVEISDAVDRQEAIAAQPSFSIAPVRVDEGAGTIEIVVTMQPSQSTAVSHTIASNNLRGSTAEPGSDYWGLPGTLVVFAPGETTAAVSVEIIDDEVEEPDETFNMRLYRTPGSGQSQTLAESAITIIDDDEVAEVATPSVFDVEPVEVVEGAGSVEVTVTLAPPSSSPTTITFSTVAATALPGQDFYGTSQQIEFVAGQESGIATITLIDDDEAEATETFTFRLFNPAGAEVADPSRVPVAIIDDD